MKDAVPFGPFSAFSALASRFLAQLGGPKWKAPMGFTGGHKTLPGIRCREERCTKEAKQTKAQIN